MNKLSEIIGLVKAVKMAKKRKEVEFILMLKLSAIGMDRPSNFEDILSYVFDDVNETADSENWHDGDVAIAFRRWIEEQSEKVYICSAQ